MLPNKRTQRHEVKCLARGSTFCDAAILVVIVIPILISLLGPHHENKHACYITICSISGVLLVGYVKGLGITLKNFLLQSLS